VGTFALTNCGSKGEDVLGLNHIHISGLITKNALVEGCCTVSASLKAYSADFQRQNRFLLIKL